MSNFTSRFFRHDLDLPAKWWHRLLKVLFAFATVAVLTSSVFIFVALEEPRARRHVVVKTMKEYRAEIENALEHQQFSDLPAGAKIVSVNVSEGFATDERLGGSLGCRTQAGEIEWLSSSVLKEEVTCKAIKTMDSLGGEIEPLVPASAKDDWFAQNAPPMTPHEFAVRIRAKYPGSYDQLSDDDLTGRVLAKYPQYRKMVTSCLVPKSVCGGEITNVVRYETTEHFGLLNYATVAGEVLSLAALWLGLGITAYYKGLVYIIYGSPKGVQGA